jgi:hypothetical protein
MVGLFCVPLASIQSFWEVGQLIRKLSLAYIHTRELTLAYAANVHVRTDAMYTPRCTDIMKDSTHRIQLVLLPEPLATSVLVFYNISHRISRKILMMHTYIYTSIYKSKFGHVLS